MLTFLKSPLSWLLKNVQDHWIWAKFDRDMAKTKKGMLSRNFHFSGFTMFIEINFLCKSMKKNYHVYKTFWNHSSILFGFVSTQIKKFGGKQIFFAFFKIFQNLGSNRKFFKCYNFTQPQCLLNILAWKLSKNWVKVIFVICMNRAIEKCAKLLFKSFFGSPFRWKKSENR